MACDSSMTIAVRFILKWHSVKNVDKLSSVCKRKIYKCHIICNDKETSGCYLIFNQIIDGYVFKIKKNNVNEKNIQHK
jgi:hypothetical protein